MICIPTAREALAFMVTAVNGSWKLPVGFFLIAGLGSYERVNLGQQCLSRLHSAVVTIVSLTFNMLSSSAATIKQLGCC